MNDVERELREMLEHKASSVGGVAPRLPETVRMRSRRRQAASATVGAFTVAAVALVSFAGLRALDLGSTDDRVPGTDRSDGYEVFERTATIETVTITSPSDWYLVNQWPIGAGTITTWSGSTETCEVRPDGTENCETIESSPTPVAEPEGLPVLQLSNIDLGLGMPRCGDPLTEGEAVLYVAVDSDAMEAGETPPPWPPATHERASGPCGAGMYAWFSAGSAPYIAWMGFGQAVSDRDREELLSTFERLGVTDEALQPPRSQGPAYVIAAGDNAAGPWRLELSPSTGGGPDANVELQLVGAEGGTGTRNFTVPNETPIEQAGGDPTFGAVTKEATGVELRLEEGTRPIPAQIVPLPSSLAYPFDLFFASNPSDVPATAVALGVGAETATSPTQEPEEGPGVRRVATGVTGGTAWALDYEEGRQLALVGNGDDVLFDRIEPNHMASLSRGNPSLTGVHDFGSSDQPRYLLYGVTHHDVDQLSIVFDDGEVITLERGTLHNPSIHIFGRFPNTSPGVWWAEMPPGPVVAEIVAFDTACEVISRGGLALQPPSTDTSITAQATCVQGG